MQRNTADGRDRNKSHIQLKDIINLLQSKYQRTVNTGGENIMDALNAATSSRLIGARQKK